MQQTNYQKRTQFLVSDAQDALLAEFHDMIVSNVAALVSTNAPVFAEHAVDPVHVRSIVLVALCKALGEHGKNFIDAGAHESAPHPEALMMRIDGLVRMSAGFPLSPFAVPKGVAFH